MDVTPIAGFSAEETQHLLGRHELMKARLVHEGQQRKLLLKHLEEMEQMRASLKESVDGQERMLHDLQVCRLGMFCLTIRPEAACMHGPHNCNLHDTLLTHSWAAGLAQGP